MAKMKVLVTGAKGTLGQILMSPLRDVFDLYGLDVAATASDSHHQVDLSDYQDLDRALHKIGKLDCIVHLAGVGGSDWEWIFQNNIIATRNVYEAALQHRIRRVVFASSNHVTAAYEQSANRHPREPGAESIGALHPLRPVSWYGSSKAFGEIIARQYFEAHRIESVCLRLGTVLKDDDPTRQKRVLRTWLSHRDLVQLVQKSILAKVKFGVYYGVSDNSDRFWSIWDARRELDYAPQDNAAAGMPAATTARPQGFESPRHSPVRPGSRHCNPSPRWRGGWFKTVKRFVHHHLSYISPLLTEQIVTWRHPLQRTSQTSVARVGDVVTIPVQDDVVIEAYWVVLEKEWGPRASLYVHEHEVLRLDCFGAESGHMHVNFQGLARYRGRMYFPQGTVREHIDRGLFELERNLGWALAMNCRPKIHNTVIDPHKLRLGVDRLRMQMFGLLDTYGTKPPDEPPRDGSTEPSVVECLRRRGS